MNILYLYHKIKLKSPLCIILQTVFRRSFCLQTLSKKITIIDARKSCMPLMQKNSILNMGFFFHSTILDTLETTLFLNLHPAYSSSKTFMSPSPYFVLAFWKLYLEMTKTGRYRDEEKLLQTKKGCFNKRRYLSLSPGFCIQGKFYVNSIHINAL